MNKKKYILAVIFIFSLLAFFVSVKHFSFFDGKIVLADDDEEDDDFYERNKEYIMPILPKEETEAVIENIDNIVIKELDSDGDGIIDGEDKHPKINDYFIVKDDNLNGIVDKYER